MQCRPAMSQAGLPFLFTMPAFDGTRFAAQVAAVMLPAVSCVAAFCAKSAVDCALGVLACFWPMRDVHDTQFDVNVVNTRCFVVTDQVEKGIVLTEHCLAHDVT